MYDRDWSLEIVTFLFTFAALLFVPGPPTWAASAAHRLVLRCRSRVRRADLKRLVALEWFRFQEGK